MATLKNLGAQVYILQLNAPPIAINHDQTITLTPELQAKVTGNQILQAMIDNGVLVLDGADDQTDVVLNFTSFDNVVYEFGRLQLIDTSKEGGYATLPITSKAIEVEGFAYSMIGLCFTQNPIADFSDDNFVEKVVPAQFATPNLQLVELPYTDGDKMIVQFKNGVFYAKNTRTNEQAQFNYATDKGVDHAYIFVVPSSAGNAPNGITISVSDVDLASS